MIITIIGRTTIMHVWEGYDVRVCTKYKRAHDENNNNIL